MVGVRRARWGPEGLSRQEQVMGGKRAPGQPGPRLCASLRGWGSRWMVPGIAEWPGGAVPEQHDLLGVICPSMC